MAKRTSGFESLIGLPWWVSIILAGLAYSTLTFILPSIEFANPMFRGFSKAGSALAVPAALIFLFASALSFFLQFKKSRLVDSQTSIDSIRALPWKDFEFLLSEAFRRQGYAVQESLKGGADGGIDLVLTQNGEVTLVQCKNWKNAKVGVTVIRELFGVVKAEAAHKGIVVCSGRYSQDALDFANRSGIQLVGSNELVEMISKVQNVARIEPLSSRPACPRCGRDMVQRMAKRGKNAGTSFWGCSQYPNCKGTL